MALAPEIQRLVDAFKEEFGKQEIRTYASSTAYCMLLSVVPVLIIASSILPHTALTEADMVGFLLTVFPDSSERLIRWISNEAYRVSGGILPVSIVFMLWSAGFGMMQLTKGLNFINGVAEKRNYFLLRGIGTFYAVVMIVLVLAVLLLQVFVQGIVDVWESALPYAPPALLTSALRYIVLFVLAFLFIWLVFTTMPAKRMHPLEQIPGALVATISWEFLNVLFTIYVRFSPHLNAYYGSLTTIVVLVLWIYWSFYLLLFGAFSNCYIMKYIVPTNGPWNPAYDKNLPLFAQAPCRAEAPSDAEAGGAPANVQTDHRAEHGQAAGRSSHGAEDAEEPADSAELRVE